MLRKLLFCTILCSTFFSAMFFLVLSKKPSSNVNTEVHYYKAPAKKRDLFPLDLPKYGIFPIQGGINKPMSEITEQAYVRLTKQTIVPRKLLRSDDSLTGPHNHPDGYTL